MNRPGLRVCHLQFLWNPAQDAFWGSGFRVRGLGSRVRGLGVRIQDLKAQGLWASGTGFGFQGTG